MEGIALERQTTEALALDLLQLDLTTQDQENKCDQNLLEAGIRSVLPRPKIRFILLLIFIFAVLASYYAVARL